MKRLLIATMFVSLAGALPVSNYPPESGLQADIHGRQWYGINYPYDVGTLEVGAYRVTIPVGTFDTVYINRKLGPQGGPLHGYYEPSPYFRNDAYGYQDSEQTVVFCSPTIGPYKGQKVVRYRVNGNDWITFTTYSAQPLLGWYRPIGPLSY